ncbi:hypothetical protein [Roseomonas rosulenta]|uniref:hypothetical protein n=1 Tax=Roseomonas rosulenta TaxID=2748667 RepID=UPI0018DF6B14|nr:hypothetical protein [Roseomonas rosulenta]
MSSTLVSALHSEERSIIAELRASKPFQRLEGIQKLLALYDAQPSVSVSLGFGTPEPERATAPVIQLAHTVPSSPPIPMPGPVAAEAAVAEVARASQPAVATASMTQEEPAGVVSSVRAALLGIGKP